jgi:antitoxin component YwqK of YwqJK toxin-antitoxin module
MKNYLIISLLFLSLGFSQKEYSNDDLMKMDNGLWTEKFSDKPISGKVYGYFGVGVIVKKVYMGNILKGKKEGRWKSYHSNGKKKYDENYKDGKLDGLATDWYKNGQKGLEGTYKDGKEDGLMTWWYENGQKQSEETYKNGKLISYKEWNEDGSVKN